MNYIPLIKNKLDELSKVAPDLSFGDLLYCILRKTSLEQKPDDVNISWLTDIKDKDFYTSLEKALKTEEEYKK